MTFDSEAYLKQFDPHRDDQGWVIEDPINYAQRIQRDLLPSWPEEALIEWLHRHNTAADRYAFIGFENFIFHRESWSLEDIPDRSAFWDPKFCDNFEDVDRRSRETHGDWLAKFMMDNGTWNTPPILLKNHEGNINFPSSEPLKSPYHLLEGHRRLSFLNGLKKLNKANSTHDIWIVEVADLNQK